MSETWNQEPIGPRLYGSAIYGDFYYGSIEWAGETTTSATWTNLTDASSTWTGSFEAIIDVTSELPSISWEDNQSGPPQIVAESSDGSGTGAQFTITTDSSDGTNLTRIDTSVNIGSGYVYGEKILIRDPGDTENYAIVTVTQVSAAGAVNSINETNYAALGAYLGFGTYASATDILFTDADHTLQDGDEIQFTATGTLPSNINAATNYYVNNKTGTTFKVETVVDGGNVQYQAGHLFNNTAGGGVKYSKTTATWAEQTIGSTTWTEQ
jgi:hypothetical protein